MKKIPNFFEGFPLPILEKIAEYQQVAQGFIDLEKFETLCSGEKAGGFDWNRTKEGINFWRSILVYQNFDIFFARYPQQKTYELWI